MSALLELVERCEAATGPDRELDVQILLATGFIRERDDPLFYRTEGEMFVLERDYYAHEGSAPELPYPTASLDAAMTLVPEGAGVDLRKCVSGLGIVSMYPHGFTKSVIEARAQTPALALCAAALRARASQECEK